MGNWKIVKLLNCETNNEQQTLMKQILFCFSLLLAVACRQSYSPELKRALELAGPNRQELKSVLRHYSRDRADSLKYRAACFLIENMQWHYGPQIKPSDRFWDLFLLEDSLVTLRELNPGVEKYEQAARGYKLGAKKMLIRKAIEESVLNYEMRSDLQTLNSGFLIENIEAAFNVWGRDWNKDLSFEDFCEYILPYRFHDEAVCPMREKLSKFFNKLYYTDTLQHNPHKTISYLNRFFWRMNGEWVSAGVQQAAYNFLEYSGVPSNTLYWLKNLDHGEEKQPFFYVNGRQVFCNQPQEP